MDAAEMPGRTPRRWHSWRPSPARSFSPCLIHTRYDPYGKATVYDANWNVRSAGSAYNNELQYASYRLDPETGLYQVRNRFYHTALATWISSDPIEYRAGDPNLYRYCGNMPLIYTDRDGLLRITRIGNGSNGGVGGMGNPAGSSFGGGSFVFYQDVGDGPYVIQQVSVTGSFSCTTANGTVQSGSFSYSFTEAFKFRNGRTRIDRHVNGPEGAIRVVQQSCGVACDWSKPWSFNSAATFQAQTGTITSKSPYAITSIEASTDVTCGDGSTHNLRGKDAVIDMYPGKNAKGDPKGFTWNPSGTGSQSSTDRWKGGNQLKKKSPKCWGGRYEPGEYE